MTKKKLIEFDRVSKLYQSSLGKIPAIRNISFEISQGNLVAIVGKSGSGKSTLLNILAGLDHPESGEILINGLNIHNLDESQLAQWRGKNVGIVFQFFQLIPTLTILENILLAMDFVNVIPKSDRYRRAMELLEIVGISTHSHKFPASLSGGEQQRAAIARALANDPPLIVADEPTGNLDTQNTEIIENLFKELCKMGKTVLVVTHADISKVGYNQVLTLKDGNLI